ncbi:type II toxin-antitoxin system RelE/ParE family toxin [uncultured Flavobacterium sp.]|mgnify:CR=1 FL=1|uniref:type II toxin-antitoxin system RelE/ParE family toxin n=1 Tax=uncultured Flavobacterium sp. TaxID=165435 RepID=UPI0030EDD6AA|tara:strand:+ start:99489 stop:99788 length:300 start_codon:yes stop_codon:yes gene_type:complete
MNFKVSLSHNAIKNIDNSIEYYILEANKKVAQNFLKDFKEVYKALEKNPFYQFHDLNYRFLPFKKFPYIVFYIIDEANKNVLINAVFHTSQNPKKISKT